MTILKVKFFRSGSEKKSASLPIFKTFHFVIAQMVKLLQFMPFNQVIKLIIVYIPRDLLN